MQPACPPLGHWSPSNSGALAGAAEALWALDQCVYGVMGPSGPSLAVGGTAVLGGAGAPEGTMPCHAVAAACTPDRLGDPSFRADHGLRLAYVSGAMANGIASEDLVEAMGNAGMLGFFGAAGLSPARIEAAITRLSASLQGRPYGFNLINSPGESAWQEAVADLYIRHGVPCVEASAYVSLSLPLVRYRVHGIHRAPDGRVVAPNRVIAKLSRVEVAERFWSPPPPKMLQKLVEAGHLTPEQAAMAGEIPMAQDVTMEADSGGHTDHRPALAALPAMLALRDAMQAKHGYGVPLRVGLGGGLGTPMAVAAAFGLGAAYVVTGSVNQACVESGTSALVRGMLAQAKQTDVGEAPAADMFEMGVTVQVLNRGTRFVTRGAKLYELYRRHESLEAIPPEERAKIESEIFRAPLEAIWKETRAFFAERDPAQVDKAESNPRHKMALVFRWYLGLGSRWANTGVAERQEDFQIWCGPAMGAFNDWARGSFLEAPEDRRAAEVARQLLAGACVAHRAAALGAQGFPLPAGSGQPGPQAAEALARWFA